MGILDENSSDVVGGCRRNGPQGQFGSPYVQRRDVGSQNGPAVARPVLRQHDRLSAPGADDSFGAPKLLARRAPTHREAVESGRSSA